MRRQSEPRGKEHVEVAQNAIDDGRASEPRVRAPEQQPEHEQAVIGLALGSVATDPDVASWAAEGDRRRREGQAPLVAAWSRDGNLRAGVDGQQAADVLWTLTAPEVYRLLLVRLGWTPDAYERWLTALLGRELFG